VEPILIVITDGRGNVGETTGYEDLQKEIDQYAAVLAAQDELRTLLLDTSAEGREDFAARRLTNCLRASRLLLWRLKKAGRNPADLALKALG
jgi:Mg-chelatase subunit ChlD